MLTLVKTLMALKGSNQTDLAAQAGISKATLSRYLNGVTDLKSESLIRLLYALGSSPDDMLKKEINKVLGGVDETSIGDDVRAVLQGIDSLSKKTLIETVIAQGRNSKVPEVKAAVQRLKKYRDGIKTVRRLS